MPCDNALICATLLDSRFGCREMTFGVAALFSLVFF
jgi:hypothetical protein